MPFIVNRGQNPSVGQHPAFNSNPMELMAMGAKLFANHQAFIENQRRWEMERADQLAQRTFQNEMAERQFEREVEESDRAYEDRQEDQETRGGYLDIARERAELDEEQWEFERQQIEEANRQKQDQERAFGTMFLDRIKSLIGAPPSGGQTAGPRPQQQGGPPGGPMPSQLEGGPGGVMGSQQADQPEGANLQTGADQQGAVQPDQQPQVVPRLSPGEYRMTMQAARMFSIDPQGAMEQIAEIEERVRERENNERIIEVKAQKFAATVQQAMAQTDVVGQGRITAEKEEAMRAVKSLVAIGSPEAFDAAEQVLRDAEKEVETLADGRTAKINIPGVPKMTHIPYEMQGRGRRLDPANEDTLAFWMDLAEQRASRDEWARFKVDPNTNEPIPKTEEEYQRDLIEDAERLARTYGNWYVGPVRDQDVQPRPGSPAINPQTDYGGAGFSPSSQNGQTGSSGPKRSTGDSAGSGGTVYFIPDIGEVTESQLEAFAKQKKMSVEALKAELGLE